MSFELDDAGRTEPRWIEYGSGRVKVRFKVRPRDLEVVKKLNAAFALDERLTRAGRARQDPQADAKQRGWMAGYLTHHLVDWDVTQHGAPAPIDSETVMRLTDGMIQFIFDATAADDLRDFEAPGGDPDPFPGCASTSKPGSTSPA